MGTLGRYEASFNTKERPRNPRCRREAGVSTTRALTVQGTPTRPTRAPPPASPPATPTPTPTAPPTTTTGEGMASTLPRRRHQGLGGPGVLHPHQLQHWDLYNYNQEQVDRAGPGRGQEVLHY